MFEDELKELNKNLWTTQVWVQDLDKKYTTFENLLGKLDVGVDVNDYRKGRSWAVVSLQGVRADFIKFVDLDDKDIRYISNMLKTIERAKAIKLDVTPNASELLMFRR